MLSHFSHTIVTGLQSSISIYRSLRLFIAYLPNSRMPSLVIRCLVFLFSLQIVTGYALSPNLVTYRLTGSIDQVVLDVTGTFAEGNGFEVFLSISPDTPPVAGLYSENEYPANIFPGAMVSGSLSIFHASGTFSASLFDHHVLVNDDGNDTSGFDVFIANSYVADSPLASSSAPLIDGYVFDAIDLAIGDNTGVLFADESLPLLSIPNIENLTERSISFAWEWNGDLEDYPILIAGQIEGIAIVPEPHFSLFYVLLLPSVAICTRRRVCWKAAASV